MSTPTTSFPAGPSSPTMSSMSSVSSFDMVSDSSRSSSQSFELYLDDSDDEIIWSIADGSLSPSAEDGITRAADDDFVVLGRRQPINAHTEISTPTANGATTPNDLASDLARLSINQVSANIRRNKKAAAAAATVVKPKGQDASKPLPRRCKARQPSKGSPGPQSQSPSPTPVSDRPSSAATLRTDSPSKRTRRQNGQNKDKGAAVGGGFASRPIVDDISERPESVSEGGDDEVPSSMYQAAASYINSFLVDQTSVCRLTLLQSLIIELGLCSSALLPASITAAKATLKSHAFLNVREYLDARQRGPAAVQNVMHPSKAALIRDLRKKRNSAPLKWIKETGLAVLLVTCYH